MNYVIVGTNYKYSPIEIRERISFTKRRLRDAIHTLKGRNILKGAVILSTCNRIEIHAITEDEERGAREIEDFISLYHKINRENFHRYIYRYSGESAIRHLFLVASGLDSLILGETQILGQIRFALLESGEADFMDGFLKKIFYHAISFAKKIHAVSTISEGKVSVGSVAVDFIREKSGSLANKNILIIGVGKITELVLKYLRKEKPNIIFVANRTFEKAKKLADIAKCRAVRFDELEELLQRADIVISATASPHFIIKKETLTDYRPLLRQGYGGQAQTADRRLIILDLALPRDVEPVVAEVKNVELFGLEDLDSVINKNLARKVQEAKKVKEIIEIEVKELWAKFTESEQERALLPLNR
jgi:glutamyl-tRNA reductase